jgi:hypothetical protein
MVHMTPEHNLEKPAGCPGSLPVLTRLAATASCEQGGQPKAQFSRSHSPPPVKLAKGVKPRLWVLHEVSIPNPIFEIDRAKWKMFVNSSPSRQAH